VAQQLQRVHVLDLGVIGQCLERTVRLVDNDEIGHLDNACDTSEQRMTSE
jgi:hypothetical protein